MLRFIGAGILLVGSAVHAAPSSGLDFFEKRIRPVLVQHCYKCHSAQSKKTRGGLALDTRAGLLAGGETGPAIVVGDPGKSLLMKALRHEGPKMPSESKKLPDAVIADFETWIKRGAADPRAGETVVKKGIDYAEGRKHWAYQPVKVSSPPGVRDQLWPKGDLDKYILARIEAKELRPSPDASAATLLRRLSFDIVGLPPTVEEAVAFEAAQVRDGDAEVKAVVDRLLASPRFGEHWGRHWLDGVRFNPLIPTVEFYRDWVIRAVNADMPYDRFLLLQLAGDLLPSSGDAQADDDRLIATQMLCLNSREMDPVEGCVEVVGQQLLGVSLNCAKCHDHKFDAFSQQDYYALAGIFTSTAIGGTKRGGRGGTFRLRSDKDAEIIALAEDRPADTNLLLRGEKNQKGQVVPRRFPIVLAGDKQAPLGQRTEQSGRRELARWLTDPANPLTARVMANRVWQRLMGRPIVATPNDFGAQGQPPSHPQLLDYLANRFVNKGWSVKKLVREIVLSRTYRQSSRASADVRAADPENTLFDRMPVKRLQCEQLVDALFFVGGALDTTVPRPVAKPKPRGGNKGKGLRPTHRAVFGVDQQMAKLFDAPEPELLVDKRESSVTAPQMLFFLNSPIVHQVAAGVAHRAAASTGSTDPSARLNAAYRILFGREPSESERKQTTAFLNKHGFERTCHLLLCASEFMYLE